MSDKKQVKSCYALKRGHSFIAMSADRATLEALRHGQDETVVEGFFTTARPESPLVGTDKRSLASFISTFKSKRGEHFAGYQSLVDELSEAICTKFGTPQKESLDLEKVLEEFDKKFLSGWRYGEHDESLTRAEVKSFIASHWPKPDPRFVEVGKIVWPKKEYCGRHMNNDSKDCLICHGKRVLGHTIDACKAAVEKAKGQPHAYRI